MGLFCADSIASFHTESLKLIDSELPILVLKEEEINNATQITAAIVAELTIAIRLK